MLRTAGSNVRGILIVLLTDDGPAVPELKSKRSWTYADYRAWNDGQPWELIEGGKRIV